MRGGREETSSWSRGLGTASQRGGSCSQVLKKERELPRKMGVLGDEGTALEKHGGVAHQLCLRSFKWLPEAELCRWEWGGTPETQLEGGWTRSQRALLPHQGDWASLLQQQGAKAGFKQWGT